MKSILSLLSLLFMMMACTENDNLGQVGYLYLGVNEDNTTITRSKPVTDEELRVDIISSSGDTIRTYTDYTTQVKGQKLNLPAGTYKVAVSSVKDGGAAWEMPFYSGVEEVVIKADEITQTQVTCQIANTKVSVKYIGLDKYFTDYCDTVCTNAGKLIYAKDEYRAGYFTSEGDLTANLYLRNKDGNTFVLKKTIRDIAPRTHYTLKYTVEEESSGNAGADIDISVDDDVTEIEYTISIKEDDLRKGVPTLKLVDFKDGNTTSYQPIVDGEPNSEEPKGSMLIKVPAGIYSLKVIPESTQFTNEFEWNGTSWTDSRFPALVPVEGEENTYNLDFATLMKSELQPDGKKPATHTFTIVVIDNLNQEERETFSITIKPDVKVLTEAPVVWSSFAVLKGSAGDPTNSTFAIREKGGNEYTTIPLEYIRVDTESTFSTLVIGLKQGVTYEYYAVSGEDSSKDSPEEFTVATVSEVPNLGFEEWRSWEKGKISGMGGTFLTPTPLSYNYIYWDSGNWGASAAGKRLCEGVDIVALSSSNKAAKLSSQWAGILSFGAFAAGSVFSGEAKTVDSGGADLLYGQSYTGFPSHLKGYYKYTPGTIDYVDDPTNKYTNLKGTQDQAIIYIALSKNAINVTSRTKTIIPFSPNDNNIFAYGELVIDKSSIPTNEDGILNDYTKFDIPLIYRDNMPNKGESFYIIIVATSSRYGDYFVGSTSSVMYVDEFSLEYGYDAQCLSGTSFNGMTPFNISE